MIEAHDAGRAAVGVDPLRWDDRLAADVAHYAKIVWRNTTAVGCTMSSSKTDDILVWRYEAAGNVTGNRAYRVRVPHFGGRPGEFS